MRKIKLLITGLIVLATAAILLGMKCGNNPPPVSPAGLYNLIYNGVVSGDCCSEKYYFIFSDSISGRHYYWIGIEDNGELIAVSEGKLMQAPFANAGHYIYVNYTLGLETDKEYDFRVYASDSISYIGDPGMRSGDVGPLALEINESWNESTCRVTCCTKKGEREYAQIYKTASGVIGAGARIKARFGKLCGQDYDKADTAFSCAWVGISYDISPDTLISAQTGFQIHRNQFIGQTESYVPYLYAEVYDRSNPVKYLFLESAAYNNISDDYSVSLDISTGTISFYFNNNYWGSLRSDDWRHTGSKIGWGGEILNFEDDMPRTYSNPCIISNCHYNNPDLHNPKFKTGSCSIILTNQTEWGLDIINDSTFHIWDSNPLP